MNSEDPMKFAVVNGHDTLARSGTLEGAHRASRRKPNAAVSSRVVEMNRAGASRGRVPAVLAGNLVVFNKPIGYIPTEVFNAYRTAATQGGAHFDRSFYANVAPLHAAAGVIASLRAAGFEVEMTPELVAALAGPIAAPAIEEPRGRGLVSATLSGQQVVFEKGRISDFNAFKDAVSEAKYDGRVNSAPPSVAVGIIKKLIDAGFSVDVSPQLAEYLKNLIERAKDDVDKSGRRVEELDVELKKRGLALYSYQKEGIAWLSGRQTALLLDDTGVGKTVQTLLSLPDNAPVVVVCPAVVKGVWRNHVKEWRPDFKVTILSGKKSFRWPESGEIVVMNYDLLPSKGEYGEPLPGTVLVGDECQWLKGKDAARSKKFRLLAEAVREHAGRTWGLSATPILNKADELWNILETFGVAAEAYKTKSNFARLFGGELVRGRGLVPTHWEWTGVPTPEAPELLKRVSLRRRKVDVLKHLPVKAYQNIPIELSAKDRKALERELAKSGIDIEEIIAAIERSADGRESLPAFTELSAARKVLADAKIPALLELIQDYEDSEEPIVVFSSHRGPVDALAERPGWARISGSESSEKKFQVVEDFQAGKLKGIAATIRSAGTGITLTRAKTSIFVDQDWTPGSNEQAEDRICRIGSQTGGCQIKIMVADHAIDERVNELLAKKRLVISKGVDASSTTEAKSSLLEDVDFDALAAQARREAEIADRTAREIAEAREKLASMGKEERERVERERERERDEERVRRSDEEKTGRARGKSVV